MRIACKQAPAARHLNFRFSPGGRFGLRWQSEAATPLLPPAEPKPMAPARASRAAKAVAPSGGCRTLPPQSKALPARILGRGTSRAREQRPKFQVRLCDRILSGPSAHRAPRPATTIRKFPAASSARSAGPAHQTRCPPAQKAPGSPRRSSRWDRCCRRSRRY